MKSLFKKCLVDMLLHVKHLDKHSHTIDIDHTSVSHIKI